MQFRRINMLTKREKYNFIGKRNTSYDGVFYTAVKTTKIFCLPSCRAQKPLEKNVIFYDTKEEAINSGFRACKVCKP